MAADEATDPNKVEGNLHVDFELRNQTPDGSWVTRPVAESIDEAIDRAPIGALYELVYAALAQRLRSVLNQDIAFGSTLIDSMVHTAVNFRSLNPNFFTGGGRVPTIPPNSGAGAGDYHSSIWGVNKDERLPQTLPQGTTDAAYAPGQDPTPKQNKGLLVAKLFADLESHIPLVLFNITSKTYVPTGIGGSAATKRFYKDGYVVSELGYKVVLSVEATAVTEDDESASNLQAIVEATFGTLRDQVGTGSAVMGSSWQLTLPTQLSPSPITETEAPWSQGDDKGGKLYVATVGLENMMFEAITYAAKPIAANLVAPPAEASGVSTISLAVGDTDPSGPIRLQLGKPQRLVLSNTPLTSDLTVSQSKRVVDLRKPFQGSGAYEIIPRRTGEATLVLYDTGMTISATSAETGSSRVGEPLAQRKVVVTAV